MRQDRSGGGIGDGGDGELCDNGSAAVFGGRGGEFLWHSVSFSVLRSRVNVCGELSVCFHSGAGAGLWDSWACVWW